jgi:prepilin-type N-terminal cleavage/methylation domain-containing protein
MKLSKNKKGFTLVELLLVMAIIGILAGIVFIMIGPSRKKARVTVFKKTMSDIAIAATDCVDDGGTIQSAALGESICNPDYGIGKVPAIKSCGGGGDLSDPITIVDASMANMDDFEIRYTCPISSGIQCYASCTINGCKFDNDDADGGDNDGCPTVK